MGSALSEVTGETLKSDLWPGQCIALFLCPAAGAGTSLSPLSNHWVAACLEVCLLGWFSVCNKYKHLGHDVIFY